MLRVIAILMTIVSLASVAMTARAAGNSVTLTSKPGAADDGLSLPDPEFLLEHYLRLNFSPLHQANGGVPLTRFGLELGYGRSLPPQLGAAPSSSLPYEFWGRTEGAAVKGTLKLNF